LEREKLLIKSSAGKIEFDEKSIWVFNGKVKIDWSSLDFG